MSAGPPTRITPERIAAVEGDAGQRHARDLDHARHVLARDGIDADAVIDALAACSVAAPSWALGTGGTRFGRFPGGGEPRTTEEKIDDVAALHALTGANRSISLHVPWDDPADPAALRAHADAAGVAFDAMNSNTFQDNPATTGRDGRDPVSYKFGSFSHASAEVRDRAVAHNLACIELGEQLGSTALTVWLADGANHPGQADHRRQFERVADCMARVHDAMPGDWTLLVEHKPYEPAFYSTVNADWGSSLMLATAAGERAACLVDLGHHLPNTNIPQVVSRLAMVNRLGGFHFNDSMYGDDDLTVGSIQPYRLFLIALELAQIGRRAGRPRTMPGLRYMIDASHNVKDPLEDLIQSTDQIQVAFAQALLVDLDALDAAQDANDAALAAELLQRAYRTDVRSLVAEARARNGAALDPLATFRSLRYRAECIAHRGADGTATGL